MENDSHALFVTKKGIHLGIEMKYYENGEDKYVNGSREDYANGLIKSCVQTCS